MSIPDNLPVRQERSAWRDASLSQRHRDWGFNLPAADIDFLLLEFNRGRASALVEYKRFNAKHYSLTSRTFQALTDLADRAGLPFAIAKYWPGTWSFQVTPMNALASEHFASDEILTEHEYVQRLYQISGQIMWNALVGQLNHTRHGSLST